MCGLGKGCVPFLQALALCLGIILTLRRLAPGVPWASVPLHSALPGLQVPWLSGSNPTPSSIVSVAVGATEPSGSAATAAKTAAPSTSGGAAGGKGAVPHAPPASTGVWHRLKPGKGSPASAPPALRPAQPARGLPPARTPRAKPSVRAPSPASSLPAGGPPEIVLSGKPQGYDKSAGSLARLDPKAFIDELEPCVTQLMTGKEPQMLQTGVPSLTAVLVVHAKRLKDRELKMRKLFTQHNLRNWSFIEGFDGDAIDVEAQKCFFGPWLSRISGKYCCNRESSSLKPHLVFFAMVTKRVQGVLIVEDDVVVSPSKEPLRTRLAKAAALLDGCDMVRLSDFSIGYMMSNAGARKMLHYSLRRGGKKISNPMDWQQDEVRRAKYHGFRECKGPKIFSHYGHKTNQGGQQLPPDNTTTTKPTTKPAAKPDAKP